jgi:hypothetical protein
VKGGMFEIEIMDCLETISFSLWRVLEFMLSVFNMMQIQFIIQSRALLVSLLASSFISLVEGLISKV